jgi:hypothetical protein
VSRSTISVTQRASCARLNRAGMRTTMRSPSRYAETVRRRRLLRRTSTAGLVSGMGLAFGLGTRSR